MRVLVTGATGFVGSAVARHLRSLGHHPTLLVRERSRLATDLTDLPVVSGDLRDQDAMTAASDGVDAIVHCAALLGEFGPAQDYWDVNVAGTRYLLDGARRNSVRRFIFVGSPSALTAPTDGDRLDITESAPFPQHFLNEYSRTKARAERIVQQYNSPTLETVTLRPRAVWGPGDTSGPFMRLLAALRAGRLPDLFPGRPVLASVCHIDRLTNAVGAALTATEIGGRSYFIADDTPWDIWQSIHDIARRVGVAPPRPAVPPAAAATLTTVTETLWRVPAIAARTDPPLSAYVRALLTTTTTYDTSAAHRDLNLQPSPPVDQLLTEWLAHVPTTPLPTGRPPLPRLDRPARVRDLWVVIPALNEEKLIGGVIAGLAAQDYSSFRMVVVDNGSTDATRDVVAAASAAAGIDVTVIDEPTKGTGAAADTGMRFAIAHGATHLARIDADCIPETDWLAHIVAAFGEGNELISGRMLTRTDENLSRVDSAIVMAVVDIASLFGRFRSGNRSPEYVGPYVMTPGCNMAISAELYVSAGGFPRTRIEDLHEDRALVNAVRTITTRYSARRDVRARCSQRRIEAWGIRRTLEWYADHRYRPEVVDIR